VGAFGEGLKHEREKRKITLDEVANATKISTRMLRAIEQEQFDRLPGGIFNKGFVRAYARHLGLNEDEIVAGYLEAFRATQPQEQIPLTPEAEARKIMEQRALRIQQVHLRAAARIPWGIVTIALLLVALGLVLWDSHSKSDTATSAVTPIKQITNPTVSVPSAPAVSTESLKSAAENQSPASVTTASTDVAASASGLFHVIIRAHEDSWIQITADGKQVLEDTIPRESQRSVDARNELIVKAGNIGGLEFWFNGQKLPAQGDLDQVKTLTFDSAGLVTASTNIQPVAATVER
jgi:cytoskeleton protein RodZ